MAEKNKKLTPFQEQTEKVLEKISEYRLACEANIVSIIYKNPERMYDTNLTTDSFEHNTWKVYWEIAHDIIIKEKKKTLDNMTVGLYLKKHPKLMKNYMEYGGYDTIVSAIGWVCFRT